VLYLPASLVAGALRTIDPRWAFGLATLLTVSAIALFCRTQPATGVSRAKDTAPPRRASSEADPGPPQKLGPGYGNEQKAQGSPPQTRP
jgi:hypothetical protein